MKPNTITRRDALKRGGKVVAGAAALPVAMTAVNVFASEHPDAELLELEREWLQAKDESLRNTEEWHAAQARMPKWAMPGCDNYGHYSGWPEVDRSKPPFDTFSFIGLCCTRPSLRDVRAYNRHTEGLVKEGYPEEYAKRRAKGRARVRAWVARRREQLAWEEQSGVTEKEARSEAICERLAAIETRIQKTPGSSPAGVAVKLRVYAGSLSRDLREMPPGDVDWNDRYILSALSDTERLSPRAAT